MVRRVFVKILALFIGFFLFGYGIYIPKAYAGNGCGPQNSPTGHIATKFFLYPYDGLFNPACEKHDDCYNLTVSGKTKEQCDNEFQQNLYKICEDRSFWKKISQNIFGMITNPKMWGNILIPEVDLLNSCKKQADYAVWAVSTLGESSVSGAIYSLKVTDVKVKRIVDTWSDDELSVCVTVKNDSNLDTEWDLVLLKKDGNIADVEPDTYERNIKVGQIDKECVTTDKDFTGSISDLRNPAQLTVRVDDYPGLAQFKPVAVIEVPTDLKPYDKYNAVHFDQQSKREAYEALRKIKEQVGVK
jgi:hypothetical protein